MSNDDLATDLCLTAIDQMGYLRTQIKRAIQLLVDGNPLGAHSTLEMALDETDVGKMKVWQSGEQPF